jgi:ribosomal protein L40E
VRYPEPYSGLHHWVARHKRRTGVCQKCGAEGRTDFANISREYRRDADDFVEVCRRCHYAMDRQVLAPEERRRRKWAQVKAWREANPEKYRAQQERKNAARRRG